MELKRSVHLRENLNGLLKKDSRSPAAIAKILGINKSNLHNWQNGVLPNGLMALLKVAEYFNVSLLDLLFEKNKNPVLHQVLLDEKYEILIRKIEASQEKPHG